MPVLPVWLTTLLIKFVLPMILADLVKAGLLTEASKIAVQYGVDFDQFLKTLKIYPEYPVGKNGEQETVPPAETNITPVNEDDLNRELGRTIRNQYPTGRNGE